jgi:phosphatidylglycerophosphatase A
MRLLALILATSGGVGYLPGIPGTYGSAVGVLLCWGLAAGGGGFAAYAAVTIALGALGVWAAGVAERAFGQEDDRRIVIDEVVGQLLALAPAVLWLRGGAFLPALVTGFVLFRVLDIAKPGPVRWAEQGFPGGLGVVADDVVAGLISAVLLAAGLLLLGAGGAIVEGAS